MDYKKEMLLYKIDDVMNSNQWNTNAQIGWQYYESVYTFGYINGYLEAANSLIDAGVNNKATKDSIIFPIMFLYRQYLELLLKWICRKHLTDKDYVVFINKNSHNINNIYSDILRMSLIGNLDKEDEDYLTQVIIFFLNMTPIHFISDMKKTKN